MSLRPYKRILLKLSGEALQGNLAFGVEKEALFRLAEQIKGLQDLSIEIGIVVGGGNLFRGEQIRQLGLDHTPSDQVGMLATLMNGILLQQALEKTGVKTRVFSAIDCGAMIEKYSWRETLAALHNKAVVIFVGGTSNPYFTTDTAAALRAAEIHADVLFKLTKVDGIYDKDPRKHPGAQKFQRITYAEVLAKELGIMDLSAIALCKANKIPICVFGLSDTDCLKKAALGEHVGTFVTGE